jgi:hypothetical protein
MVQPHRLSDDTIEEAILAFDAGNHAWGRYRLFVLATTPEAMAVSTDAVRDALQEAALSVPDARSGDSGPFLAAARAAFAALLEYRRALPEGIQLSELNQATFALEETVAVLEVRPPEA